MQIDANPGDGHSCSAALAGVNSSDIGSQPLGVDLEWARFQHQNVYLLRNPNRIKIFFIFESLIS